MAALSIPERVAWLHMKTNALKCRDLVELKFQVKAMVAEATALLDHVNSVLDEQRRRDWERANV